MCGAAPALRPAACGSRELPIPVRTPPDQLPCSAGAGQPLVAFLLSSLSCRSCRIDVNAARQCRPPRTPQVRPAMAAPSSAPAHPPTAHFSQPVLSPSLDSAPKPPVQLFRFHLVWKPAPAQISSTYVLCLEQKDLMIEELDDGWVSGVWLCLLLFNLKRQVYVWRSLQSA